MALPAYAEVVKPGVSPTEERSFGSFRGQRRIVCAWTDRYTVSSFFLDADGGFGQLWPYDPTTFARAVRTSIVPYTGGADDGTLHPLLNFQKAFLVVSYETPTPESIRAGGGGRKITESIEPSIEFQTLGHKGFNWGSPTGDPLTPAEAPGRQVHFALYKLTIHHALSVPRSAFSLMGHVNDSDIFTILSNIPFPKETLLMLPTNVQHTIQANVGETLQINLSFSHKVTNWNKFFRKKTQDYERIHHNEGLEHLNYPLGPFSTLVF